MKANLARKQQVTATRQEYANEFIALAKELKILKMEFMQLYLHLITF